MVQYRSKFQFLIGRLVTIGTKAFAKHGWNVYEFQFLIGRLVTRKNKRCYTRRYVQGLFQFLIGRLVTFVQHSGIRAQPQMAFVSIPHR
jgi:hypothetical protein